MLNVLRAQLVKIIEDIDTGNSNITEEDTIEITKALRRITRKDNPMSKYQAYTYLKLNP